MKIVLVTVGSRGDVQPMIALSLAFKAAHHDAVLVGPPERMSWAREMGCPYLPLGSDVTAFIDSLDNAHTLKMVPSFIETIKREIDTQFEILPDIIKGADLVVGASLSFGLASITESMGIAYRFVAFTPQLLLSSRHPCPVIKNQNLPGWLNRLGWNCMLLADRLNFTRRVNQHRRQLGLKPIRDGWIHILGPRLCIATDPQIAGIPDDAAVDSVQTGYMHLNQPPQHLPELEEFLERGAQPVYAGFGSMPRKDQMRVLPLFKKAARRNGRRLVVARFWDHHSEVDPEGDVFYISRYPHGQLFPRMAAIIHHGGAGTTATAARSGVPQIIIPHVLDQYYWGHNIFRSGLGPRPIRRAALTTGRLTRAIQNVIADPGMAQNAKVIQREILATNGVENAVQALLER